MKIEIIRDINHLDYIKKDWVSMYESDDDYTVFQSFEYNYYSSTLKHDQLFVIVLKKDDKIIQIWPCVLYRKKLKFINQSHADYCDILSHLQTEEVCDFILQSEEVHSISFQNVRPKSKLLHLLGSFNYLSVLRDVKFLELNLLKTDNFPSNFTHFVHRQRRRLKRILQKYDGNLMTCQIDDSIFPRESIIYLRKKMIDKGVRNNNFLNEDLMNLMIELYNSGKLKISILRILGEVSSISCFFQNDNKYLFWIDLFDEKKMVNIYHNTLFMKKVTSYTDAVFNFGRGDYLYKTQNFNPKVYDLYNVHVFKIGYQFWFYLVKSKLLYFLKLIYKFIK